MLPSSLLFYKAIAKYMAENCIAIIIMPVKITKHESLKMLAISFYMLCFHRPSYFSIISRALYCSNTSTCTN